MRWLFCLFPNSRGKSYDFYLNLGWWQRIDYPRIISRFQDISTLIPTVFT